MPVPGKSQENATAQMRKNPWPPGIEVSRVLVRIADKDGKPLSYTVVVER